MTRRVIAAATQLALPVVVVTTWWWWSTASDSFYFPPLIDILRTFGDTWLFEQVGSDVVPSLARLGAGYGLAAVVGVGAGIALGLSPSAHRVSAPILEFLRAIPPPALIPPGIVVLGVGNSLKVLVIALASLWPILLNTTDGVAGVQPVMIETARSYGCGPRERLRHVILPAALPQVFAGLRTSLSVAIIVMVVSEMVASTEGIGFFILRSQRSFAVPEMWSGVLLLGVLGLALNAGLTGIERRVLRWHPSQRTSP